MTGLFKGIRKDPRKFASNLEFLSINEIIFYKKRFSELHLVSQCDFKRGFHSFKSDMVKFSLASFCVELVDSIMPLEDKNYEIYSLLVNFLGSLDNTNQAQKLLYSFTLKALAISGFQPHLESCVVCKSRVEKKAYFSNHFGGLLCSDCSKKDSQSKDILTGTILTILFYQDSSWLDSLRLSIMPQVEKQLRQVLFSFLKYNLERKFKSLNILNEVLDHNINV